MKPEDEDISTFLKNSLPSAEKTKSACEQVWQQLRSESVSGLDLQNDELFPGASKFRWPAAMAIAAAGLLFLLVSVMVVGNLHPRQDQPLATVEGRTEDQVRPGQVVRTTEVALTLTLHDGTRIEMRSESELSLERAQDGLSIRLEKGGVIVNAAKQHGGHLYVVTKDLTVSVIGTVFFVNAEETGSRVAVIEGEVQVRGTIPEAKLLAGEQVATNPAMASTPIIEEISWSQNATSHIALLKKSVPLLQRSPLGAVEVPARNQGSKEEDFELASIRAVPAAGGRGAPGTGVSTGPCIGGGPQIDPGRFVFNGKTLYYMITAAYGMGSCLATFDRLSGGPGWVKSDLWAIQAVIPEGTPNYSERQFNQGNAPKLQGMLQNLLADRFKLTLHRETKELPVYLLTVGKSGSKVRSWKEGDRSVAPGEGDSRTLMAAPGTISGSRVSMTDLAMQLSMVSGRTVLDRTGLTGEFIYSFQFAALNGGFLQAPSGTDYSSRPSLFSALEEQLGLKLESSRGPVEVFVIDHVEKPSEN